MFVGCVTIYECKKVDDLAKKQTHQNNYLLKTLDFAKLFCTLSLGNNGYL